jgi:hypothetical protein
LNLDDLNGPIYVKTAGTWLLARRQPTTVELQRGLKVSITATANQTTRLHVREVE